MKNDDTGAKFARGAVGFVISVIIALAWPTLKHQFTGAPSGACVKSEFAMMNVGGTRHAQRGDDEYEDTCHVDTTGGTDMSEYTFHPGETCNEAMSKLGYQKE